MLLGVLSPDPEASEEGEEEQAATAGGSGVRVQAEGPGGTDAAADLRPGQPRHTQRLDTHTPIRARQSMFHRILQRTAPHTAAPQHTNAIPQNNTLHRIATQRTSWLPANSEPHLTQSQPVSNQYLSRLNGRWLCTSFVGRVLVRMWRFLGICQHSSALRF